MGSCAETVLVALLWISGLIAVYLTFILLPLLFILSVILICLTTWAIKTKRATSKLPVNVVRKQAASNENFIDLRDWAGDQNRVSITLNDNVGYVSWLRTIQEKNTVAVIPQNEIIVVRQLGEGAFGYVHLVQWVHQNSVRLLRKPHKVRRSSSVRRLLNYVYSTPAEVTPNVRALAGTPDSVTPDARVIRGSGSMADITKSAEMAENTEKSPHEKRRGSGTVAPYMKWRRNVQQRTTLSPLLNSWHRGSARDSPSSSTTTYLFDSAEPVPDDPIFMAMKLLKFVTREKLKDLEREAVVLTTLNHPNIVQFYGMTVQGKDGFALLFEFMECGDLVHYLRNHNPDLLDPSSGVAPLMYSELLQISMQVASGLEYLSERHLVHRDLAARNCLVGQNLIVKLSDFGMTRDLYVTDYYRVGTQTLVPLRWLPPESVVYRKFTTESDVWSLGVLFWEVFSYGQVPWYAYSNSEVLDFAKEGRVLEKPEVCPGEVYESLILACCKLRPRERISATRAKRTLETLLENTVNYCSLENSPSLELGTT